MKKNQWKHWNVFFTSFKKGKHTVPTYSPRISSHTIRPFASLLASEAVSSRPAFTDFVRRSSQILENAAAAASAALSESLFKLQGREGELLLWGRGVGILQSERPVGRTPCPKGGWGEVTGNRAAKAGRLGSWIYDASSKPVRCMTTLKAGYDELYQKFCCSNSYGGRSP